MSSENFKIDFIIIGAHKSGTSWLHKCLEEHPQVCMPKSPPGYSTEKKVEPDFFNDTQLPWGVTDPEKSNYKKGLAWYASLFEHCDSTKLTGESSPIYFNAPEVPERIYKDFPSAKLIVILRNPIDRLLSHYNYTKLNSQGGGRVPGSFSDFIKSNEVVALSQYYHFIENYLRVFPKDQLKVMIYEDIRTRPHEFMQEIYAFLNIDNIPDSARVMQKINSVESRIREERQRDRKNVYGKVVAKLVSFLDIVVPTDTSKVLATISDEDRAFLSKVYREDVSRLESFLGRKLSEWY